MTHIMRRFTCAAIAVAVLSGPAAAASRRTPVVEAIEKCSAAVVNISTERIIRQQYDPFYGFRDRMFNELFREFHERFHQRQYRTSSLGSGVIIDTSGLVVTNEHVINRASKITITLSNGKQYNASLISSNPEHDLAVLKIESTDPFPSIQMGTSSDLMIGETVIAMGNPFGFQNSVSVGVLSATERSVQAEGRVVLEHLVQIDAAINPGNSGGPLININGELIGINTAIVAEAQGIGFALPIDRVKAALAELLDYRLLKRLWLGVHLQQITPEISEQLGVPPTGALVTDVDDKSPAASGRLRRHDVIVEADGAPVADPFDFARMILRKDAGDKIALKVLRDRREVRVSLAIEKVPQKSGFDLAREKLGLGLQKITPDLAQALHVDADIGLIVTDVTRGGPAFDAGVARGDLILRIAGHRVSDPDTLAALMAQVRPKMRVQVLLYRGNAMYRGVIETR